MLEKYLIPGSGEYMIPLALYISVENNRKEVILLLHESGKEYAANTDNLAKQLVAEGYTVLLADLPGIGELGPGYLQGDAYISNISYNQWFAGILTGRSIAGLRAEDITRLIHFVKTNFTGIRSVSAISTGVLGSELLHAAVFDGSIEKVCLLEPFTSFAEIALSCEYSPGFIPSTVAGALEAYDLADLMAALYPRKLLIINPLDANGNAEKEKKAGENLAFPIHAYAQGERGEEFSLITGKKKEQVYEEIFKWLARD
jgi:hypothetical protein